MFQPSEVMRVNMPFVLYSPLGDACVTPVAWVHPTKPQKTVKPKMFRNPTNQIRRSVGYDE